MTDPARGRRRVAIAAGWLAVLAFFGIAADRDRFFIGFHPPFTSISPGEAKFWLATLTLLTPAGLLLGYGHASRVGRLLAQVDERLRALSRRDAATMLLCGGLLAAAIARTGNELVMLGYPVTDDEWAAKFGGEVLAQGRLMITLPFGRNAFPWPFMYVRGDQITSMDWLGTQLAWTISTLSRSGHWVFALSAALPVPCVAFTVARRLSRGWGLLAGFIALTSPMGFALSMSTHGHLHSRGLLAVGLALHVWAHERRSVRIAALTGLSWGTAVMCRPFESAFFLAPLLALEAWDALREGGARRRMLLATVATALVPIALLFIHARALTGGWLPARHSGGALGQDPVSDLPVWVRFGSNSAYNLLRLTIWFAGPIGAVLCAAGLFTDRLTRSLGLGVLSLLALGLFHTSFGIHAVGPIHYSECLVPLTVLAAHGLANLTRWMRGHGADARLPASVAAVALGLTHMVFNAVHAVGLHGQAELQARVYGELEGAIPVEQRPAVVLCPQFGRVWDHDPRLSERGSWVFQWRRPRPDFGEDLLILQDSAKANASVRAAFPGRHFFRMQLASDRLFRVVEEP